MHTFFCILSSSRVWFQLKLSRIKTKQLTRIKITRLLISSLFRLWYCLRFVNVEMCKGKYAAQPGQLVLAYTPTSQTELGPGLFCLKRAELSEPFSNRQIFHGRLHEFLLALRVDARGYTHGQHYVYVEGQHVFPRQCQSHHIFPNLSIAKYSQLPQNNYFIQNPNFSTKLFAELQNQSSQIWFNKK